MFRCRGGSASPEQDPPLVVERQSDTIISPAAGGGHFLARVFVAPAFL